jgi:phosphatidate cytidylyltransferase
MSNLTQRAITGVALVLVITTLISFNVYSFIVLILTIDLLSLLEFYRLIHAVGVSPQIKGGILLSAVMILTGSFVLNKIIEPEVLWISIPLASGIFIAELFRRQTNPFHNLAFTFFGILWITVPLCFFMAIAFWPLASGLYHFQLPLGYFLLLWASDSGAYFIGKALGVHPLFKRISPKKSWEGSLGGAASALLVAYLISHYFPVQNTTGWISMAIIIIVMGTFGDLIKSLLKRSLNLKDSGTILPGHGGMLDRFDTLLGSAPFVFCYLILFRQV